MTDWESWSKQGWRTHAGSTVPSSDATLPELALLSAQARPDRVAVEIDGVSLTHGELSRASAAVGAEVRIGDRVLLAGPSTVDFAVAYLGILRAGGVVVLANPAYTAAELAHLVTDSGAVMAFASAEVAGKLPDGLELVTLDDLHNRIPNVTTGPAAISPESVALLAYTSGTTGKPKGVPLTHRNLIASIRSAMAAWKFTADDVLVHALPLFHQHGLSGVHATLIAGSTAVLLSRFSSADLADAVARSHASVLFAVPTMYEQLCNDSQDLPGLRLCVCGSAPLSPALAERATALLGQVPLVRYGTTESGLNVSNPLGDRHPHTVGVPLPGVHLRLAADDEIQLRGAQVFGGYWKTTSAFTEDGWFRTGDIGQLDEKTGHLTIAGRIKELIITGGLNVYPREVELALEAHPCVVEAAVAGLPDDHWGEQVTAWVVVRSDVTEETLISHARSLLAAYKCPKAVYFLSGLPRNHLGKITRSALSPVDLGAFIETFPAALGTPIAVKDLIDISGQTVRSGTPGLGHREALQDSEVWARLRAAGYAAVGRTRVPELAWSVLTPGCRNPWDSRRTAGGSSGGSAVAVASGAVPVALGTDTGGSIRIPAALCGVAGLRPTWDTVSTRGITSLAPSMDTVGPIALTAAACLHLHTILGGSVRPVPDNVSGIRVGWPTDLWDGKVEPEVRRLIEEAAETLRAAGVEIIEVSLPVARRFARGAGYTTMLVESSQLWWERSQKDPDGLGPAVTELLRKGASLSTSDYETARTQAADVRAELDAVLDTVSALLLPTVPAVAALSDAPTIELGGRDEPTESAYFRLTALASVTGHPALSVPAGLSATGLPAGAQLIGQRHEEALLCLLGGVIENAPPARELARSRALLTERGKAWISS
jgi:acyl-CoA synthetase (AMP-forming)/AMP-acid ligase II